MGAAGLGVSAAGDCSFTLEGESRNDVLIWVCFGGLGEDWLARKR